MTDGEMAYGPCLAMWVCQRVKLVQKTRVMRSGMEITELLPDTDEEANFYAHGNQYLHMIKTALLEANAGQRSLVREAPTTEAQQMAGCNKEIELANSQLLQTCFERTSLFPGTAGCRLNLRKGTRAMFTLPSLLGGCRFVVSNDPHVFLANGALGLSTAADPGPKQSWWVAVDGMYYILVADIAAGGTMETVRWYKCGMNQDNSQPHNIDLAVPDEGGIHYKVELKNIHPRCFCFFQDPKKQTLVFGLCPSLWVLISLVFLGSEAGARTLVIAYHQYDGMSPRSAVMTTDANSEPLQTVALWFQKPPSTGGRRMQAQLENPSCFFFKLDSGAFIELDMALPAFGLGVAHISVWVFTLYLCKAEDGQGLPNRKIVSIV